MGNPREHAEVLRFVSQWHAEQRALKKLRLENLHKADGTIADVEEANREFAALSGLTLEEFHEQVHDHGALAIEALRVLREHPELGTPENAMKYLYEQAGNEAGQDIVDWLTKASGDRFIPKSLARIDQKTAQHEHPRRKKPKGKKDVIARADRWRAEGQRVAADDASFEKLLANFQSSEE